MMLSELIHDGGAVLCVIFVAGVAALAVFVERMVSLRQARILYEDFLSGVFNILRGRRVREALALCEDTPGPVARLMRAAIVHRGETDEALRNSLDNAGRAEVARMERRLAAISTIASATPLLGLLGTLLGLLQALLSMRADMPLVQTLDVTDGIARALVTSIAGLAVAIPAHAMYSILVSRIDRIILDMGQASGDILAFMGNWDGRSAEDGDE